MTSGRRRRSPKTVRAPPITPSCLAPPPLTRPPFSADVILPEGVETLTLDTEDALGDKTDQPRGWMDLGLQEFQPHPH